MPSKVKSASRRKSSPKADQVVKISLKKKTRTGDAVAKHLSVRMDGVRCKFTSCSFVATDNNLICDHTEEKHLKVRAKKAKKSDSRPTNSCVDCEMAFDNRRQLKFHFKSSHSGKTKKAFNFRIPGYMKVACAPKPSKSTEEASNLGVNLEYKCSICHDKFATYVMLSGHIRHVHEVLRPKPVSRVCKMKFLRFALNMGTKPSCAKKLF